MHFCFEPRCAVSWSENILYLEEQTEGKGVGSDDCGGESEVFGDDGGCGQSKVGFPVCSLSPRWVAA